MKKISSIDEGVRLDPALKSWADEVIIPILRQRLRETRIAEPAPVEVHSLPEAA
jgi:hypothetical protein